jgi:hypothetical protein
MRPVIRLPCKVPLSKKDLKGKCRREDSDSSSGGKVVPQRGLSVYGKESAVSLDPSVIIKPVKITGFGKKARLSLDQISLRTVHRF